MRDAEGGVVIVCVLELLGFQSDRRMTARVPDRGDALVSDLWEKMKFSVAFIAEGCPREPWSWKTPCDDNTRAHECAR